MAGNRHRHRVRRAGTRHRARGRRPANAAGDLGVRFGLAARNRPQVLPDQALESRRLDVERKIGLGGIAIGFMLLAPNGIWGVLSSTLRLSIFPIRRLLSAVHLLHEE